MKAARAAATHQREALVREPAIDSYRAAAKLPGPAQCPSCHAAYHAGRWTWSEPAPGAVAHRCPACERIADDMPAGYVTLKGKFLPAHRDEILGLVNARGERARAKHPLQRIISVEHAGDAIVVTTTGVHVARGIAHALHAAFKGELKLRYSKDENLLRAEWKR